MTLTPRRVWLVFCSFFAWKCLYYSLLILLSIPMLSIMMEVLSCGWFGRMFHFMHSPPCYVSVFTPYPISCARSRDFPHCTLPRMLCLWKCNLFSLSFLTVISSDTWCMLRFSVCKLQRDTQQFGSLFALKIGLISFIEKVTAFQPPSILVFRVLFWLIL